MTVITILQVPNHLLKLLDLGSQLTDQFLIAPVAGSHRIKSLLQGVYHFYQASVGRLEVVYLVYVILTFHITHRWGGLPFEAL